MEAELSTATAAELRRPSRLADAAAEFGRPVHEFRRAHLAKEIRAKKFNGVLIVPPAEKERLREKFGERGLHRDLAAAARELGWSYATVYAAARRGDIKTEMWCGRRRVADAEMERLRREVGAALAAAE
jgi:hypothetical protein